ASTDAMATREIRRPIELSPALQASSDSPSRKSPASPIQGTEPKHRAASRRMLEKIRSGEWALGSLLPVEAELEKQFRLSRYGVRQAVQVLCDLGMVERQQGVGTRVVSTSASTRYVQTVGTLDDIVQYVKGTRL